MGMVHPRPRPEVPQPPGKGPARADQCRATSKGSGYRCQRTAVAGMLVCKSHGGSGPHAKAAAERRLATRAAEQSLKEFAAAGDYGPITDPLAELAKLSGEVIGWKDWLRSQVDELGAIEVEGPEDEDYGEGRRRRSRNSEVRVSVQVYERALDRCAMILASLGRLNIDERLAAVGMARATIMTEVLLAVLAHFGLDVEDGLVRREVARQLRARRAHLALDGQQVTAEALEGEVVTA